MCECHVGPGRLEGESPITFWMHERSLAGGSCDELSYGNGSWGALELGPFDAPSFDELEAARAEGYCASCIESDILTLLEAPAITFGSDSQGFLWSSVWDSKEAAEAAFADDLAELEAQEGSED